MALQGDPGCTDLWDERQSQSDQPGQATEGRGENPTDKKHGSQSSEMR